MLARPEIGSKEDILLWLSGKDPDEKYEWSHARSCACGQYSQARYGDGRKWINTPSSSTLAIQQLNNLARDCEPRTFGALYTTVSKAWVLEMRK